MKDILSCTIDNGILNLCHSTASVFNKYGVNIQFSYYVVYFLKDGTAFEFENFFSETLARECFKRRVENPSINSGLGCAFEILLDYMRLEDTFMEAM